MQEPSPAIQSSRDGANKPIYVWAPSSTQTDAVIRLLGFVDSEKVLPLYDLHDLEVMQGGANVLLAWQGFVPYLCSAMEGQEAPSPTRDRWIEQATALLKILRQQNKHILSANIMAVQREPLVTRNMLTDLFGYRFRNDAPQHVQVNETVSPLFAHIAFQTFSKSVPARRALAELKAFSRINVKASAEPQDPSIDIVFAEVSAHQSRVTSAEFAEVTSLSEALAEELDKTREAFESAKFTRMQEVEQVSADFHETISKLRRDLDILTSEKDALAASNENIKRKAKEQIRDLEEQLSWSFSEIERYLKTSQELEDRTNTLEAEKSRLEGDIKNLENKTDTFQQSLQEYSDRMETLYNSTSWRITKPLRWIRRKMSSSEQG